MCTLFQLLSLNAIFKSKTNVQNILARLNFRSILTTKINRLHACCQILNCITIQIVLEASSQLCMVSLHMESDICHKICYMLNQSTASQIISLSKCHISVTNMISQRRTELSKATLMGRLKKIGIEANIIDTKIAWYETLHRAKSRYVRA